MNWTTVGAALCALASCQTLSQPPASSPDDHVQRTTLLVGQRMLKEDSFSPVEDQLLVAAEYSSVSRESSLGPEVGLTASFDSETVGSVDFDARVLEAYFGGRFQKLDGPTRPFIGLGGAITFTELDASSSFGSGSTDDTTFGFYVHGGVSVSASETLEIVFDVRRRFGSDADFEGVDVDIDYFTFAVGLSF
ncbi:MAG: hypothetical protein AAGG01_12415 [Planctomycetota bacterium]